MAILLFMAFIPFVQALIGYDCGSRHMNVTTLSLTEVGDCDIPDENITVTQQYVQLLQINEYTESTVFQCKLEVHRTVYYCGMHSHVSVVKHGEAEYLYEISQQACNEIHKTGIMKFGDAHVIQGLRVNRTITHSLTFAGFLNTDGHCNGASFSDPYGTWESVVVQGTLRIALTSYTARVNLNTNQIHLRSGTTCTLADSTCLDVEGGYTFWRPIPEDNCNFKQYGVLYEGYANKMVDYQLIGAQTVYSLTTNDITFALSAKSRDSVCGYTIVRTEHPKLVIFETRKGESFALSNKVSVTNLDIFAYVNSKFVYVEKHIRTQIKQLYRDVLIQRCNLERQTLKNALSIATQSPDEFAYNLMQGPGYMAVLSGEVVHIIKCIPVEVRIKAGTYCYAELQVERGNVTYFLTPRTHILKNIGTQVACNTLLPSYYQVGSAWYKILPTVSEAIPPHIIKPLTQATWKYTNPAELATAGIYSDKDLNELRERIMFPVERPALLNDLAREMNGNPVADQEGTLVRLMNEDAMKKLAESAWDRIWSRFMTFGTVSAGFISIMFILQLIKTLINIFIRGYTLHSIFGWSTHLLSALWSGLTNFLIHLSYINNLNKPQNPTNQPPEYQPVRMSDLEANLNETVATAPNNTAYPPLQLSKETEVKPYLSMKT